MCNRSEEEEDEESNTESSERSAVSRARSWIGSAPGDLDERAEIKDHGRGTQNRPTLSRRLGRTVDDEEDHDNSGMKRYIARQAMGQDLLTFSEEISEWTLFIIIFRIATEACKFSDVENMALFQKSLKGEARQAVKALLMMRFEKVFEILERRFGRSEFIIQEIMQKAIEYPRIKEDRPSNIIKYSNVITNLVATIESLNRPDYLISPTLRDQLIDKLPMAMNFQLAQSTSNPSILTVEQLAT